MGHREFWRNCVDWLVSIGSLSSNHRTCRSDASIFDLAQTLRDGVVLCYTLNCIMPGVIDDSRINRRAHMSEFLCMQNIRTVVLTLQKYFGMSHNELFTAEDLYQMTNFEQVLRTLSILSCKPQIAAHVRPFRENRSGSQHRHSVEEEDVYGNLADLATEHSLADEEEDLYDSVSDETKDEGIYGSLIATKAPAAKLDKRGYCFHEIIETESNYVSHLEVIIQEFIVPLRVVLDEQNIRLIFMNTETLHPIHAKFYDDLVKLKQNISTARISEVFLRHTENFLVYGEYCSHLIDAQDHLRQVVDENDRVRLKVEECQEKSRRSKFKLRDLLAVPMQRLLKYHLLVRELIKHTDKGHPDKESLDEALEVVKDLANYINEVKRDSEELVKINQIQTSMEDYDKGIPLHTYGRVRHDGELKVKFGDERNPSSRNVFLFDKALFMTKLKGDSYNLKDLIRLNEMRLDETFSQKSSKAKWSHAWKLVSLSFGASYVLHSKTESDRNKWIEAFKESFDNISPRALEGKSHNFVMHTFDKPTRCSCCKGLLNGTFYQGYRCTVTGIQCHKSCLSEALKSVSSDRRGSDPRGAPDRRSTSDHRGPPPPPPSVYRGSSRPVGGGGPPPIPIRESPIRESHSSSIHIETVNYKAHRDYNGIPPPPFPNASIIKFQIGQPVEVTQQVTPEWWKGRSFSDYDKIGYFPASHVSPHSKREPATKNYMETFLKTQTRPAYQSQHSGAKIIPADESRLEDMLWYAGEIDRGRSEELLIDKPTGTFLVRKKSPTNLVVSLKFQQDVKHIKVHQTDDNLHYVAECKNFRSVQDLIRFYENNSLSGFFLGLETTLKFPYRNPEMFPERAVVNGTRDPRTGKMYNVIGKGIAKYDFDARSEQELSLIAGQFVNIISKAGGAHGWWKGEYNGNVGYFPTSFVDETD